MQLSRNHFTLNSKHALYSLMTQQANTAHVNVKDRIRKVRRLYNISNLTEDPEVMRGMVNFLVDRYKSMGSNGPTHILGIPACGYILAAPLAVALGIPFIPLSIASPSENAYVTEGDDDQQGPLPLVSVRSASIDSRSRVVILDDQILTGKTAVSAFDCVQIAGAKIVEFVAICDMVQLGGIDLIHSDSSFREVPIFTFFRLQGCGDVMFPKKKLYLSHL